MKLTSRKFWITVAAMLASIATSITGMHTDNTTITAIGMICTVISSAIYAGAEAYVDANRVIETVERDDDDKEAEDGIKED
jgi:hypothetical protein